MATVQGGQTSQASQIWENERRRCRGKVNKPCLIVVGVLLCGAVLAIGLYLGLGQSTGNSTNRLVGQAEDPNSIGCYIDERFNRVLPYLYVDEELTPSICNQHCEELDYYYYALQWGKECWCGPEDVELDQYGDGECDYPCPGESNAVCGGYLSFTAYTVGTEPSSLSSTEENTSEETTSEETTSEETTSEETTSEETTSEETSTGGETTTIPSTCTGTIASVRFASSSGIAYFEGGGCATLTDMYNIQSGDGPLYTLDDDDNVVDGGGGTPTGRWLVTTDVRVLDDVTLYFHGTSIGGDCDVLRIESTDDAFHEIRGYGGSLSFKSTTVTSWDTDSGKEQTSYSGGRSFINCVSEQTSDDTCEGAASKDMGECTMNIIDSVMGNLGWLDSESYGLTWKVRGFCTDLSNPEVFDRTGVYGDIQGSEIYGMYYGMYSYGHQDGVWTDNIMHDNIQYGFDPHDDSDNLVIANNEVYGNGNHGIIASKRCNNVEIYDNEVYDGGDEAVGIFLHRSSDDALVHDNYVHDMKDAGFAILESMNAEIYDNTVENVRYGVRISLGGAGNQIYDNTFDGCYDGGFYTYEGSDPPDVSDGRPSENVFTNNVVSNTPTGVKLNEGDANEFIANDFSGAEIFELDDSTDILWVDNVIGDACTEGSSSFQDGSDAIPSC